jgi:hypothetical protein
MTLRTAGPEAAAVVGAWACEAGAGEAGRIECKAGFSGGRNIRSQIEFLDTSGFQAANY